VELEPELESHGARTFGRSRSWYTEVWLRLLAPDLGQTKIVYLIIICIEYDKKSEISQYSLQKVMKKPLFDLKAVKTGTQKA
jgi:hypothetical protein